MKKYYAIINIVILLSLFSGCISENDEIYFSLYYSTLSDGQYNFTVTISTTGNEVFNESIMPLEGQVIYQEKSSGGEYFIQAKLDIQIKNFTFKPDGYNILEIEIIEGIINFRELTE